MGKVLALNGGDGSFYFVMKKKKSQKITTFLWYDDEAEEAVKFYTSVFKNSRLLNTMRYGEAGPGPKGEVMAITF